MPDKTCPGCGANFFCGSGPAKEPCWCAALPLLLPVPSPDPGCWCPECLGREIARRQKDSPCGRPGAAPPRGK